MAPRRRAPRPSRWRWRWRDAAALEQYNHPGPLGRLIDRPAPPVTVVQGAPTGASDRRAVSSDLPDEAVDRSWRRAAGWLTFAEQRGLATASERAAIAPAGDVIVFEAANGADAVTRPGAPPRRSAMSIARCAARSAATCAKASTRTRDPRPECHALPRGSRGRHHPLGDRRDQLTGGARCAGRGARLSPPHGEGMGGRGDVSGGARRHLAADLRVAPLAPRPRHSRPPVARSSHRVPVPRGAGLALMPALIAGALALAAAGGLRRERRSSWRRPALWP